MNRDDEYISLKEAAEMTGYTADYIGQLIRSGKIHGKQVFLNVAWVTTREAIEEYATAKDRKQEPVTFIERMHGILLEPDTLVRTYAAIAWLIAAVFIVATILIAYVFAVSLDNRISARHLQNIEYGR